MRLLARHKIAVVVAVAVFVRLAVLLAFPSVFAFEQTGQVHGSEAYDVYARNLLATGVYGREPGVPDALIPPLYSVVLAGVYATVGRGGLQVGAFHILLDALSMVMLAAVGRRLFPRGDWVGTGAALAYALYPYLIFQNLTLIDTAYFMVLLHAFVLLLVLLRERDPLDRVTWGLALLAGAVLGLSLLTRPLLPLLAALAVPWFLMRRPLVQAVARLAPVAAVGALALAPWIARNQAVYGTFVPVSVTAGANFFQGNNGDTVRYLRTGYDAQWIGAGPLEADPDSPEGDRERMAKALAFLRANPGHIPELLWVKLLTYWSIDVFPSRNPAPGETPRLDYQGDPEVATGDGGALALGGLPENDPVEAYAAPLFDQIGRLAHRWTFGPLLALALAGIVASARRWRDVSLLWFVQLSMTVMYVAFHPSTRYRAPTDPLLFLFSAYVILWLVERARDHRPPASARQTTPLA